MSPEQELEVLRKIVKKANSPMWWARLAYCDNPKFWNPDEQEALQNAGYNDKKVYK